MRRSYEERLEYLAQKEAWIQQERKKLLEKSRAEERNRRTRRLIVLGEAIEEIVGGEVDAERLEEVKKRFSECWSAKK